MGRMVYEGKPELGKSIIFNFVLCNFILRSIFDIIRPSGC